MNNYIFPNYFLIGFLVYLGLKEFRKWCELGILYKNEAPCNSLSQDNNEENNEEEELPESVRHIYS